MPGGVTLTILRSSEETFIERDRSIRKTIVKKREYDFILFNP
jgi:hypothetical protein